MRLSFQRRHHPQVGKDRGQTAHQERWYNNTLRQRLEHFTRQLLAFSKLDAHHELVLRWFIVELTLRMCSSLTP
jgi:IS1 family transposase